MQADATTHCLVDNGSDDPYRPEHHYHDHLQQSNHHHQLDLRANELCSNVHSSIRRADDASYQMPTSEHVYYCSFPSFSNLMEEQRLTLTDMMFSLSETNPENQPNYYLNQHQPQFHLHSNHHPHQQHNYINHSHHQQHQRDQLGNDPPILSISASTTTTTPNQQFYYKHQDHQQQPLQRHNQHYQQQHQPTVINYNNLTNNSKFKFNSETIGDLTNSYDNVQEFTETMLDYVGENIDDAEGLLKRDAQNVEATLKSGNKAKLFATPTNLRSMDNNDPNNSSSTNNSNRKNFINQYNTNSNNNHQQQQLNQRTRPRSFKEMIGGVRRFAQLENKNIARPQSQFQDKIDNSYKAFQPIIKDKPNALVPLKLTLERDDHGNEYYSHPYEYELKNFQIDLDELTKIDSSEPLDLDTTPIYWVETVEQLTDMCRIIENEKEFAVDVEHHSYRSFQGITCLLQISTRTYDFVIDAIKLRSELYRLNKSFTDPSIVKVFHGADCDVLWLQRDFGVYVVKLFDTSRAAKLMKFAHLSLAFLMQHYCNLEPDKSYQLADWRERPLPLAMLKYARADTHFLLYIYDRLRKDLLTKSKNKSIGVELINNVYERGREICSKRYEKPPFSDTSHRSVLRKSRSTFNAKQMYAFKELYAWRDSISRELDESLGYVLPNNLMIRIAEYLPREPQGITALCNPMPPTVKKYLSDIHGIILKALTIPLDDITKAQTGVSVTPNIRSLDLDTINHKQDIAHSAGIQEGSVGPNLLDKMNLLNCSNDEVHDRRKKPKDPKNQTSSEKTKESEDKQTKNSKKQEIQQSNNQPSGLFDFL